MVQNQHLAILAEVLGLEKYMLYAHGSDLCHDSELRHAMANCFEALMGAIYLDGGIEEADHVFAHALFGSEKVILTMKFCQYRVNFLISKHNILVSFWSFLTILAIFGYF